ncbi:unnamed protein product, partial [marine sediment metagenome]
MKLKFDIKDIIGLEVTSPQDLGEKLCSVIESRENLPSYAALGICDEKFMVDMFHVNDIELKDLRAHLKGICAEFLCLAEDDIEMDYQVLKSSEDSISGIYMCLPKTILNAYFDVCTEAGIIPVKITSSLLMSMESLSEDREEKHERISFIEFSNGKLIYLSVFQNKACELRANS